MKLIIVLLLLGVSVNAQIRFEPGYFIDNDGNRVECEIKNRDWNKNPDKFRYKIDATSGVLERGLDNTAEFGVNGKAKYVRAQVLMDRSGNADTSLSRQKDPVMHKETIFLRVLFEGRRNLLTFEEVGLTRFFYQIPGKGIQQLIYKKYLSFAGAGNNQENAVEARENNTFRIQLWNDVRCAETPLSKLENLQYQKKSLLKYFTETQNCIQ